MVERNALDMCLNSNSLVDGMDAKFLLISDGVESAERRTISITYIFIAEVVLEALTDICS